MAGTALSGFDALLEVGVDAWADAVRNAIVLGRGLMIGGALNLSGPRFRYVITLAPSGGNPTSTGELLISLNYASLTVSTLAGPPRMATHSSITSSLLEIAHTIDVTTPPGVSNIRVAFRASSLRVALNPVAYGMFAMIGSQAEIDADLTAAFAPWFASAVTIASMPTGVSFAAPSLPITPVGPTLESVATRVLASPVGQESVLVAMRYQYASFPFGARPAPNIAAFAASATGSRNGGRYLFANAVITGALVELLNTNNALQLTSWLPAHAATPEVWFTPSFTLRRGPGSLPRATSALASRLPGERFAWSHVGLRVVNRTTGNRMVIDFTLESDGQIFTFFSLIATFSIPFEYRVSSAPRVTIQARPNEIGDPLIIVGLHPMLAFIAVMLGVLIGVATAGTGSGLTVLEAGTSIGAAAAIGGLISIGIQGIAYAIASGIVWQLADPTTILRMAVSGGPMFGPLTPFPPALDALMRSVMSPSALSLDDLVVQSRPRAPEERALIQGADVRVLAGQGIDLDTGESALLPSPIQPGPDLLWQRSLAGFALTPGPQAAIDVMAVRSLNEVDLDRLRAHRFPHSIVVRESAVPIRGRAPTWTDDDREPTPLILGARTNLFRYARCAVWRNPPDVLHATFTTFLGSEPSIVIAYVHTEVRWGSVLEHGDDPVLGEYDSHEVSHHQEFRIVTENVPMPATYSWAFAGRTVDGAALLRDSEGGAANATARAAAFTIDTAYRTGIAGELRASATGSNALTLTARLNLRLPGIMRHYRRSSIELIPDWSRLISPSPELGDYIPPWRMIGDPPDVFLRDREDLGRLLVELAVNGTGTAGRAIEAESEGTVTADGVSQPPAADGLGSQLSNLSTDGRRRGEY